MISSNSSESDAKNTTATSVVGFIDDEINECPQLGNYATADHLELLDSQLNGELVTNKESHPEKCFATGSGLYYGHVGIENQFAVIQI